MAHDLNLCQFIGRLGADPETRHLSSGDAVTNIRIACGWKTKDKEGTEWVPVVFFGRLAEVADEYLRKGSQVYISGRFQTRKWQDKDGNDRWSTEVVADRMQMLGGKREDSGEEGAPPVARRSSRSNSPKQQEAPIADKDFDDDIPF